MDPILVDGFKLLAVGMGMVFLFLFIMVLLVNLTAKVLSPFKNMFEEKPAAPAAAAKAVKPNLMQDKKLVAVLSEAIKTYKSK